MNPTSQTTMAGIPCPHCAASNPPGMAFCQACGKALPSAMPTGPRVLSPDQVPTSGVGHQLLTDELHKQSKKAFGALLAVAIMQAVFGLIIVAGARAALPAGVEADPILYIVVFGIAAIFFVLAFWARRSPLPAAIVGLALFVTIHALDAIADPMQLARGIIVKIIIVVVLIQAINAGVKHKRLLQAAARPGV